MWRFSCCGTPLDTSKKMRKSDLFPLWQFNPIVKLSSELANTPHLLKETNFRSCIHPGWDTKIDKTYTGFVNVGSKYVVIRCQYNFNSSQYNPLVEMEGKNKKERKRNCSCSCSSREEWKILQSSKISWKFLQSNFKFHYSDELNKKWQCHGRKCNLRCCIGFGCQSTFSSSSQFSEVDRNENTE